MSIMLRIEVFKHGCENQVQNHLKESLDPCDWYIWLVAVHFHSIMQGVVHDLGKYGSPAEHGNILENP